jgi:hypothetical protein
MADVLLREPSSRVQRNPDLSPRTQTASFYPANDTSPPLETTIHPVAVAVPVATFAWFVLATWIGFGGGETSLVLAVVTFFGIMYFGLLVSGGALSRDVRIGRNRRRSVREFFDGDVEIATGRITGRQALAQIATLQIALAIGGSVIIAVAVLTRI